MVTRVPASEVFEATLWSLAALAVVIAVMWPVAAWLARLIERHASQEQTRIDEQAAVQRLEAWKAARRG